MMSETKHKPKPFKRGFKVELLDDHINNSKSLIGALFNRWTLPGQPSGKSDEPGLRLAVRDGYVNFYVNGQSVAKLETPGKRIKWTIAPYYLKKAGMRIASRIASDRSAEITHLEAEEPSYVLTRLIEATKERWSAEKCFVEHLIARNPNIIDIEMGLPGHPELLRMSKNGKMQMFSPRMDIVAVQPGGSGRSLVQFWEVKLANNAELRAALPDPGEKYAPHVASQLQRYRDWFDKGDRRLEVAEAYRTAADKMSEMAGKWRKTGEAVTLWSALRDSDISVSTKPGVIVGNYDPKDNAFPPIGRAASFQKYKERLEANFDYTVVEVPAFGCGEKTLMPLPGDCL